MDFSYQNFVDKDLCTRVRLEFEVASSHLASAIEQADLTGYSKFERDRAITALEREHLRAPADISHNIWSLLLWCAFIFWSRHKPYVIAIVVILCLYIGGLMRSLLP